MSSTLAYLDYNATAPLAPGVAEAVLEALREGGNPSSVHSAGRRARARLEAARAILAEHIGAKPQEIIFTGSGTEANHLALAGLVRAASVERILVSAVEHDAVLAPARSLGVPVTQIAVSPDGVLDLGVLEEALQAAKAAGERVLVSVMMANNETGVIQPVREIGALVSQYDCLYHCDAIQGLGKMVWSFNDLGADCLSLSAHKIGGPHGVGALVVREGVALAPLVTGGGQELNRRAGTENVAGISGFAAAVKALEAAPVAGARLKDLRDGMEARLIGLNAGVRIFGQGAPRLDNTSAFAAPGLSAETLLMALDLAGIAVSTGAACSSGKVRTSHVLSAMGVAPDMAAGAIRVSLGPGNGK